MRITIEAADFYIFGLMVIAYFPPYSFGVTSLLFEAKIALASLIQSYLQALPYG